MEGTPLVGISADCPRAGCDTPYLLQSVSQKAGDPLTGGCEQCDLDEVSEEDFKDDGVKCQAENNKVDPCVCHCGVEVMHDVVQSQVDWIIHQPVYPVGKLWGLQQEACHVL